MRSFILVSVAVLLINCFNEAESVELIEINANENEDLKLKSALSYLVSNNESNLLSKLNSKRIIWSFKRIYFNPKNSQTSTVDITQQQQQRHVSNNEIMISIDADVEEKLIGKYSISDYDLVIKNLTYEDSGLFICKLWNQKQIVYQVIVNSAPSTPLISFALQNSEAFFSEQKIATFNENSDIVIRCVVRYGFPFGEITWYQNNVQM